MRPVGIEFPAKALPPVDLKKGIAVVTKAKDLRTGRSIWEQHRAAPVPHQPLRLDIETDVLVIGAGITGAMVADALRDSGLRVVVVDRRGPAKGSTTASTALVQYEIDTPLTKLTRKIGKPDAERAWRRSKLAVDALTARFQELGVADVARRDSLYLSGNVLNADGLAREHDARRAAGLPSRWLGRKELRARFGIARSAALLGYGNLAIDPRKVTLGLLREAATHGAKLLCPVDIVGIEAKRTESHGHGGKRQTHSLPPSGVRQRLRAAETRAEQRTSDRIDLGDRNCAAEAAAMAGAMHDLGGVGSLSLRPHHG